MKIDFAMLEKLAAAGATANVIIEFLRAEDAKKSKKRVRDRSGAAERRGRPKATGGDYEATQGDKERLEATIDETPRARCFRICKPILISMGLTEKRAGGALAQWLKATSEDTELIAKTCEDAQRLSPADPIAWVNAQIMKRKGNGQRSSTMAAADGLIARAKELEREAGFGELDLETIEGS